MDENNYWFYYGWSPSSVYISSECCVIYAIKCFACSLHKWLCVAMQSLWFSGLYKSTISLSKVQPCAL
jgi:hypothetical protein